MSDPEIPPRPARDGETRCQGCGHPESHHVEPSLGSIIGGVHGCVSCDFRCEIFLPPARDGETLSDGARAEIQEFRHHLEGHAGTTFPGCRFCSSRDAAEVRRHQAQRLSESEVAKVRESLEQGNSCKPRIALWLCDTIAALRAELAALIAAIDNELVASGELGTFKLGDDPKAALHKLACWNQSVGAYFAARAASGKDASHE